LFHFQLTSNLLRHLWGEYDYSIDTRLPEKYTLLGEFPLSLSVRSEAGIEHTGNEQKALVTYRWGHNVHHDGKLQLPAEECQHGH